jgi:hypothetical protein
VNVGLKIFEDFFSSINSFYLKYVHVFSLPCMFIFLSEKPLFAEDINASVRTALQSGARFNLIVLI